MINLKRSKIIPTSLKLPEIEEYLDKLSEYRVGLLKTKPDVPTSYRSSDLLNALEETFEAERGGCKCYLTEEWFSNARVMEIDHFIPKAERPELTFDWDNLFLASHYANTVRSRKTPNGGFLNPCIDNVEKELKCYSGPRYSDEILFEATDKQNLKAINTANELNQIYNGKSGNEESKKKSQALRNAIYDKIDNLKDDIIEWLKEKDEDKKSQKERKIRLLVSRKSAYSVAVRSHPVIKNTLPKDFFD